jgi:hypothetical protein
MMECTIEDCLDFIKEKGLGREFASYLVIKGRKIHKRIKSD